MSWEHNATASWWSRYIMFIPAEEERFETIDVGGRGGGSAWRMAFLSSYNFRHNTKRFTAGLRPDCRLIRTETTKYTNTSQRIGARVKAGLRPDCRLIQDWNNQIHKHVTAEWGKSQSKVTAWLQVDQDWNNQIHKHLTAEKLFT